MTDLSDIDPCPSCGALPCDWSNNPFAPTTGEASPGKDVFVDHSGWVEEVPMSMREKLARAMWEDNRARWRELGSYSLDAWEAETDGLREDWMKMIDAVLTAMREPTPEMANAALKMFEVSPTCFDPKVSAWDSCQAYRKMIDQARKG